MGESDQRTRIAFWLLLTLASLISPCFTDPGNQFYIQITQSTTYWPAASLGMQGLRSSSVGVCKHQGILTPAYNPLCI